MLTNVSSIKKHCQKGVNKGVHLTHLLDCVTTISVELSCNTFMFIVSGYILYFVVSKMRKNLYLYFIQFTQFSRRFMFYGTDELENDNQTRPSPILLHLLLCQILHVMTSTMGDHRGKRIINTCSSSRIFYWIPQFPGPLLEPNSSLQGYWRHRKIIDTY